MSDTGKELQGGMVLLDADHFVSENPWGKPVVGWNPTSEGIGGLQNPMGFAALRVVLWKMLDSARVSLYDQIVIVENPGAVVICELEGRVGLIQVRRMVGPRLIPDAGSHYIRKIQEGRLWSALVKTMGRDRWEAPRGIVEVPPDELNVEEFVIKAAKLEALEEAGFAIEDARVVGTIQPNSTFFLHPQYVVHAKIKAQGAARPEDLEIIGNAKLFTSKELRALNASGHFNCDLTMSALWLCGIL